jgi:hypothetical protein
MHDQTQYTHVEGLGWIATAIAAVATLVPMVIKAFKKPPKDVWSGWSKEEKATYVNQALIAGIEAKKSGEYPSVESFMVQAIAQVELDENWETWKKKNEWVLPLIADAEVQANQLQPKMAGIISANVIIYALVFGALGYAYFKRDLIKARIFNKQIAA